MLEEIEYKFVHMAIDVAQKAREHGNHPFGAVLVGPDRQILMTAENSVVTENDVTGHAETNLVRLATRQYPPEFYPPQRYFRSAAP